MPLTQRPGAVHPPSSHPFFQGGPLTDLGLATPPPHVSCTPRLLAKSGDPLVTAFPVGPSSWPFYLSRTLGAHWWSWGAAHPSGVRSREAMAEPPLPALGLAGRSWRDVEDRAQVGLSGWDRLEGASQGPTATWRQGRGLGHSELGRGNF